MNNLFKEFLSALWEVFKLPFFLVAEGFRRLFRLGWRKITMLTIAAFILTFVVLFAFVETTSQPQFCGSCHLMEPYIEAWKTSSHDEISCMACHAKEGVSGFIETKFTALSMLVNYATGLYKRSKPWAEIDDKNCLQCHETRLLDGKITMENGVHFDHTPHLTEKRRGRQLRCTSCHSQIVQGEHISITPTTCFLCHFKNLEKEDRAELASCTKCHDAPTADQAKYDHTQIAQQDVPCQTCHQPMWQGEGLVRKERCGACHSEVDHIERFDDLEFIHEWHIEKRKVDCQRCHDPIEHHQPDLEQTVSGSCSSCHSDPHAPKLAIYKGQGSRLVEGEHPDVMFESGVACISCHKDPFSMTAEARIGDNTCEPCHAESYKKLADNWKEGFGRRISTLERRLRQAGAHPRIEDARHDLALLKSGGAWHNPEYAQLILAQVEKVLNQSGVATSSTKVPAGSRACLTCHNGIEGIEVGTELSAFDHSAHLSERTIVCTTCHVGGEPEDTAHGRRRPVEQSCATCHHDSEVAEAQDNCAPCHLPSRSLYLGEVDGVDSAPSPMADAAMGCTDCHDGSEGYASPTDDFCFACHEQEVIDDWKFVRGELVRELKLHPPVAGPGMLAREDHGRAVHHPDLAKDILGLE
ncbi:NapC/NirT family cytochrome c [bacterium]|nr:NapC/NirT family cytochrome c [bacterium]